MVPADHHAKVAFFLGGRRGTGVLTVRDSRGRFSNPVFINLTGGSLGWQFGAQETDVVLVFTTRRGIEGIADGKLTLGVGASVAAGPVGRQAEAAASTNAEVFAYSRSRGLFAGVALDGTASTIDARGNEKFYGRAVRAALRHHERCGPAPVRRMRDDSCRRWRAAPAKVAEAAVAGAPSAPAAPHSPANAPTAVTAAEVRTFPMEDPAPGSEPPR